MNMMLRSEELMRIADIVLVVHIVMEMQTFAK